MSTTSSKTNKTARGLRNNNPLNIRKGSAWKGLIPKEQEQDKQFCEFETMAYGFRAAACLMRNYNTKHGLHKLRDIISRWAPASENNTADYVSRVCLSIHVTGETSFYFTKERPPMLRSMNIRLLLAMMSVECGLPYAQVYERYWNDAEYGYALAIDMN